MAIDKDTKKQANDQVIRQAMSTNKRRLDGLSNLNKAKDNLAEISIASAEAAANALQAEDAADRDQTIQKGLKTIKAAGLAEAMDREGQAAAANANRARFTPPSPPPADQSVPEPDAEDTESEPEVPEDQDNDEADDQGLEQPEDNQRQSDLSQQELERYQQQQRQQEARTRGQEAEKQPYQEQGGEAIRPQETSAQAEARKAAQAERAAARRAASAEGKESLAARGASALAKGGEAVAGAARAVGTAFMSGLRALGTLYVNPATAPWAWGITIGLICVILLLVSASALYGASASSPNSAGKSLSQPVPAFDSILTTITNESNIQDVATTITNSKQKILDALMNVESQIQAGSYDAATKESALAKLADLRATIGLASTTDTKANLKLAEDFQTKLKELVGMFTAVVNSLTGTALPINESKVTQFGNDGNTHGSTLIYPGYKSHHNSYFGCSEKGNYCRGSGRTTADAIDLMAPTGTEIYAPFDGDYVAHSPSQSPNPDAIFLTGKSRDQQHTMVAVLAHCTVVGDSTGHVSAGQVIAHLHSLKVSAPHLHFELRVDGKDVTRTSAGQTHMELWNMMKTILSGGS